MSNRESIKVICRLRPENQKEKDSGQKLCITPTSNEALQITVESEKKNSDEVIDFTFDRVFGSDSRQIDVFNYAAVPIINGAMQGYNGTLFCYGQTSSGKTFTMEVFSTLLN